MARLVVVFAITLTLSAAARRYNVELVDAARELRTLDLLLANEAGRSLQSVQLILDSFVDQVAADNISTSEEFAERYANKATHDALRARVAGVPQLDAITIVSASGKLINFSRSWPIPQVDLTDRDYFKFLRDHQTNEPFLSEPVINRGSGTPTIYLVRRVSAPDGALLGLVLGAIELSYFERFYASLHLGPDNSIALWRRDGILLARYPPSTIGQRTVPSSITAPDPSWHGIQGVFEEDWTLDKGEQKRRVVASEVVDGFPVQVNIARGKWLILQDWWREFVAIGTAVSLAVLCLIVLIWALLRRFHAYEAVAAASIEREKAILARQEAEDALRQAQKMEAVGQLTGGVAHDFNNLLTVVQSSLDLMRRPNLSEERRARYVDAIEDATNRAVKLTGQLLAFARRQALKPEVFDVVVNITAVGDLIDRLTGSRVTVQLVLPEAPCFVQADPNQFDTSIVNMAVNGRDAMENGGRLTLTVRTADGIPPGRTHAGMPGSFVAVSVSDTGAGIAPDLIERVFEPFFTTKRAGQGTGLGLSQVFGFAKQSGGEVVVESEPGCGTTFTLYLPRVEGDKAVTAAEDGTATSINGDGRRVLVVEDNEQVARAALNSLVELGYQPVWADSAEAALDKLDAGPDAFQIVFSDVMMPGMTGIELGQIIRDSFPALPVLLTSGYSDVVAKHGSDGFPLLQKPYSVDELARALRKAQVGEATPHPTRMARS